ncbi:MAG: 5'-methylthioadenosine/S-adenosylhomocysteine nucleosidase [Micrococcales bacterium]|nr:5'-methylthioadenosine/S-adenosylhomocysteine nucleosidase [Micrococcales bacterium]
MIGVDALVVVAMADEAEPFMAHAQVNGPATQVGGSVRRLLTLADRTVLLVRSGIGLVNAACAASCALATFRPSVLVSAGSAGGLGDKVRVGDVVVADQTVYSCADTTGFGYALGQVPGMPERYTCDAHLAAAAAAAGTPAIPTRTGLAVSSDSFVTASIAEQVRTRFPAALTADMETTALAQVAYLFDIPFVSVRGVSDLCGPAAGYDHATHVDDASERSAAIVVEMLTQLTDQHLVTR